MEDQHLPIPVDEILDIPGRVFSGQRFRFVSPLFP